MCKQKKMYKNVETTEHNKKKKNEERKQDRLTYFIKSFVG